jgi:uncharacterized cupin superfamily protein
MMATGTVDRDAVARDWRERGFSCDLWIDPPGQVWADYVHQTDELVMVVKGDVAFEIEGQVHQPAAAKNSSSPRAPATQCATSEALNRSGCTAIANHERAVHAAA